MSLKTLLGKLTRSNDLESAPSAITVKDITPDAAHSLVNEQSVTVLDIRTPAEFSAGHIPGAINIDFQASQFESSLISLDKKKPYLMHCAAGGRSSRSLPVFRKLGFTSIYHLTTGYKGWEKAGLPVAK